MYKSVLLHPLCNCAPIVQRCCFYYCYDFTFTVYFPIINLHNCIAAATAAKSLQSCPTLCDPMDCSPPGSCVHGILQARYWSGLPWPPPGALPNPGIKPMSLMSPALAGRFFITSAT